MRAFFHKYVTCKLAGHVSTGLLLTNTCDRCFSGFTVTHTAYTIDGKISTGR